MSFHHFSIKHDISMLCAKKNFSQNFLSPTLSWTKNFLNTIFFQREIFFHHFSIKHDIVLKKKKKKQNIWWKFSKFKFVFEQKFSKFNFVLDQKFSKYNFFFKGKCLFIISPSNMTFQGFVLKKKFSQNFLSPTLSWTKNFSIQFFFKGNFFSPFVHQTWHCTKKKKNKIFGENFLSPTLSLTKNFLSSTLSWTKKFLNTNFFSKGNVFSSFLHQTWHFKALC